MGSAPSSNAWREKAVTKQVRAHGEICSRLNNNGQKCEPYFSQTLNKAKTNGLVSNKEFHKFKAINRAGNNAKHNW